MTSPAAGFIPSASSPFATAMSHKYFGDGFGVKRDGSVVVHHHYPNYRAHTVSINLSTYLLTLSAKVCLNGNSGNKQYLGGESVHLHVEFWVIFLDQLTLFTVYSPTDLMSETDNGMSFTIICFF